MSEGVHQDGVMAEGSGHKSSPAWKYVTTPVLNKITGAAWGWQCIFCKKEVLWRTEHGLYHLIGPAGKGINICGGG